ncbi:MAG: hypothetical protein M0C28_12495 [Candidatus Moduliflexus flocculans]|nr:hypothetical protein [Candidatus Moduliflexus flocculans]
MKIYNEVPDSQQQDWTEALCPGICPVRQGEKLMARDGDLHDLGRLDGWRIGDI